MGKPTDTLKVTGSVTTVSQLEVTPIAMLEALHEDIVTTARKANIWVKSDVSGHADSWIALRKDKYVLVTDYGSNRGGDIETEIEDQKTAAVLYQMFEHLKQLSRYYRGLAAN